MRTSTLSTHAVISGRVLGCRLSIGKLVGFERDSEIRHRGRQNSLDKRSDLWYSVRMTLIATSHEPLTPTSPWCPKPVQPMTQDWEAEFLVDQTPATRAAYASDLQTWKNFATAMGIDPQTPTRASISAFSAHANEILGLSAATVSRRLSALSSYLQYGVDEGLTHDNPASRVRRPRLNQESTSTGLTKTELSALLGAARTDSVRSYTLLLLLSLNGLRVSEALAANVEDLSTERGHVVLRITRKGGKEATIPLNATTANAIEDLTASKTEGPIFESDSGGRMSRQGAWRLVRRLAKRSVPDKAEKLGPHSMRHSFVTLSLDAGASLRDVQDAAGHADPRTTRRYDRSRHNLDANPTYLLDDIA